MVQITAYGHKTARPEIITVVLRDWDMQLRKDLFPARLWLLAAVTIQGLCMWKVNSQECVDMLSDCGEYIKYSSQCQAAKDFFTKYCPKTCGYCVCADLLDDCSVFIKSPTQCQPSAPFFDKYCRQTCNMCGNPTIQPPRPSTSPPTRPPTTFPATPPTDSPPAPVTDPPGPTGECRDVRPQCAAIVADDKDYCKNNAEYMKENCAKSCNFCETDCEDLMPQYCASILASNKEYCKTNAQFMKENCPKSCNYCVCEDILPQCARIVANNKDYCQANAEFMKENCPRSCDFCGIDETPKPSNDCFDKKKRCKLFAGYKDYCVYQEPYMRRNCPKSCQFCDKEYNFAIQTEWNGVQIKHAPVTFQISAEDSRFVRVFVSGPFFDDPGPPPCRVGACDGLWDYEVAEVFFLGDKEKYLEVELGPHGQHLLLMLNGVRKPFLDKLPLQYTATIDRAKGTWTGTALIPVDYFPPRVHKINAYAIHGSGVNRVYESLYPAPADSKAPDFHRLEFFKSFDFQAMFPMSWSKPLSLYWKNVKRMSRARSGRA